MDYEQLGPGKFEKAAYDDGGLPETKGKTFDGRPVPSWDGVGENVRAKWMNVAAAHAKKRKQLIQKVEKLLNDICDSGVCPSPNFIDDFLTSLEEPPV